MNIKIESLKLSQDDVFATHTHTHTHTLTCLFPQVDHCYNMNVLCKAAHQKMVY